MRKWLTRGDRYRVQHVVNSAIETFVSELWDRWRHRREGWYKRNGEYSSITFRYVLRAVHAAYENQAGYPSKREVVDVAQGLDPDRSRRTHEEALRVLCSEHGQVKMAHRGGNEYVWYPANEPDPPNAKYVKINGNEFNPNS